MLKEIIDGKPVCFLRIVITKDNILRFSNCIVRIYDLLYKFAAHLKTYGCTPVANHCCKVTSFRFSD
jgi:hypothetical protein